MADFGDSMIPGLTADLQQHLDGLKGEQRELRAAFQIRDEELTREISSLNGAVEGLREPATLDQGLPPAPVSVKRMPSGQGRSAVLLRLHQQGPTPASALCASLVADGISPSRQAARALLISAEGAGQIQRTGVTPIVYALP